MPLPNNYDSTICKCLPIPATERAIAWVCSRSLAEVAGSSPAMNYQSFLHQLMHKRNALKEVLKFTLKQLQHVSV